MENERPSKEKAGFFRAVAFFTGDMQACGAWVNRQSLVIQLLDWILRGVAQVMFVNNPFSGLLIAVGLFLQNPWWALNGLVGTLVATVSALLFGYKRDVMSAGLQGYNGTLVGMLMAVFSAKEAWYWWLLLPNAFMSMLCPLVSGAFSSVTSKLDLPVFTLPFNVLLCLHMAATGASHPFFPEVAIQPELPLQPSNVSIMSLDFHKVGNEPTIILPLTNLCCLSARHSCSGGSRSGVRLWQSLDRRSDPAGLTGLLTDHLSSCCHRLSCRDSVWSRSGCPSWGHLLGTVGVQQCSFLHCHRWSLLCPHMANTSAGTNMRLLLCLYGLCHLQYDVSVWITSLHVAFLPVHSHLPPHFLRDGSRLQAAVVSRLLPRKESTLQETTITGLRGREAAVKSCSG
ncbi:uncharacterized protein ACB058_004421 isoform 1-T3 [Synchiropus picturatus]